jgi:hypothetical protein
MEQITWSQWCCCLKSCSFYLLRISSAFHHLFYGPCSVLPSILLVCCNIFPLASLPFRLWEDPRVMYLPRYKSEQEWTVPRAPCAPRRKSVFFAWFSMAGILPDACSFAPPTSFFYSIFNLAMIFGLLVTSCPGMLILFCLLGELLQTLQHSS